MLQVKLTTIFKLTGLLSALFLFGCVTTEVETKKPDEVFTPLTVSDPGFNAPAGTHIAWYSEAIRFYKDPRIDNEGIKSMIDNSIVEELSGMGYRLSLDADNADYLLGYGAALESALNSDTVLLQYGLMYGYGVKDPLNEKATFVLYLLDGKTRRPVWKSMVQGAFNFSDSNSVRAPRIKRIIQEMFSTLKSKEEEVKK
jgi:hypothetical protein